MTLADLEYRAAEKPRSVRSRRPLLVLTGAFAVVLIGGVAIGLLSQPDSPQTTIPVATTPSTSSAPVTTTPAPATTAPAPTDIPVDPSGPFAVITADSVEFFRGETHDVLDIPDVRKGVVLGDQLIFGLNGSSGVWAWPARSGSDTQVPGGTESAYLLVGQTDTETSAWFEDAATVDARDLILFREIESETDPIEERMMILDLVDGDTSLVFDKAARRDDLLYEEVAMAFIADAALTSDGVVALFGFGDATWIEPYDLTGERLPDLDIEGVEGTVLELDAADHLLALGVETEFHAGIQEVWIVDLRTGALTGPYTHEVEGESLRDLAFDGSTITAGIQDSGGNRIGLWVFDGADIHTSSDPAIIALP